LKQQKQYSEEMAKMLDMELENQMQLKEVVDGGSVDELHQ
jgi:hypothetical protein